MIERQLTVDQVAQQTGDSPYTVRKLLREGKMRGQKNGTGHQSNPWRVPESAVDEFMAQRAQKTTPQAP